MAGAVPTLASITATFRTMWHYVVAITLIAVGTGIATATLISPRPEALYVPLLIWFIAASVAGLIFLRAGRVWLAFLLHFLAGTLMIALPIYMGTAVIEPMLGWLMLATSLFELVAFRPGKPLRSVRRRAFV